MLDKSYIKKVVTEILKIESTEFTIVDMDSLDSNNIDKYLICVNLKQFNKTLGLMLENIIPLQHKLDSEIYNFDNLSREEVNGIKSISDVLQIKVNDFSKDEAKEEYLRIEGIKHKVVTQLESMEESINDITLSGEEKCSIERNYNKLFSDAKKVRYYEEGEVIG